jgi:hypothetical protein
MQCNAHSNAMLSRLAQRSWASREKANAMHGNAKLGTACNAMLACSNAKLGCTRLQGCRLASAVLAKCSAS